jgi:hypothetical protein
MTVRVLADRHHADLAESLLKLFEDRFGWEVYFPIGLEWADEGLWDYANGHPGVTAQFLGMHAGMTPCGCASNAHYTEVWPAHPARTQKLVTLPQFRAMRWDYLLASVTQHERLWHDLADRIGARSILQVGNVGQPVDWGLSHLVMAAANVPIPDGRGVVYHPEFDLDTYAPSPPLHPRRITSLMNCLPDAGQAYVDWQALQAALPEFEFREYGILGRDGIIGPASVIAAEMRAAGFAFHNKPQGDGYGFVVHQWSAVGRPLIGRASYYAGKLAEPLWAGSLDLARGDVPERIRELADRPQDHMAACVEQVARFEATVDFDAEAARIFDYLT